jgi:hypothetical protein
MTIQKALFSISLIFLCRFSFSQSVPPKDGLISSPADIGLIYPLSTHGRKAAQYDNRFSLQILSGVNGAIHGAALAGIANVIRQDSRGTAIAGIVNQTGGMAQGVQVAGIANILKGSLMGSQIAGVLNTAQESRGLQLAGLANRSRGAGTVQISGLWNRSDEIHTQLAGLCNIATHVRGIQISGLLNIADSSDYPIGFINIIKDGQKSILLETTGNLNTGVSFRSGGRVLYGILGLNYHLKDPSLALFGLDAGLGVRLPLSPRFEAHGEARQSIQTDFRHGHCYTYSLRVLPEMRIADHVHVFAGPSVNLVLDYSHRYISDQTSHYFWTSRGHSGHFIGSFLGMAAGVAYIL